MIKMPIHVVMKRCECQYYFSQEIFSSSGSNYEYCNNSSHNNRNTDSDEASNSDRATLKALCACVFTYMHVCERICVHIYIYVNK